MPTSSQSLILLKADSRNVSNYYKHSFQIEAVPLSIPRVNVTGDLPSFSPSTIKTSEVQDSCYLDHRSLDGGGVHFSGDNMANPDTFQRLPASVEREKTNIFRICDSSGSEDGRNSQGLSLDDDILKENDFSNKQKISVDNYRRLLDLGFSTSSFKGLEMVDIPRTTVRRVESMIYRSINEQSQKVPRKLVVPLIGGGFSMCDQKPTPRLLSRRRSANRSSSWLRQYLNSEEDIRLGKKNLVMSRHKLLNKSTSEITEHDASKENQAVEEVKKPEKKSKIKLPTIRMRKVLPPTSPGSLCFTLRKVNASHEEIKNLIETQLECAINTLLFDPVYIHMGETDSEYKTMWVFTLNEKDMEKSAIRQGIKWNGERSRVRYLDDVMREEYNAYRLYKAIQDEKKSKGLGSSKKRQSLA